MFFATIESPDEFQTKVYAGDDLKVLWDADDRVMLFNKHSDGAQYRFDGETGFNEGSFSRVSGGEYQGSYTFDLVYSVYPYDEEMFIYNTGEIQLTLPAIQTYRAHSFGPGANTMISATENNTLVFKNLCGYLAFKLYGEGVTVKSIKLSGNSDEPIAGSAVANATMDAPPTVVMGYLTTSIITLDCGSGVELDSSSANYTEFWIVVPPITFSNGFNITVTDIYGGKYTKSTSQSITISRNHISRMAPLRADTNALTLLEDPEVGTEWDW